MQVNLDHLFSITEANQNFSKIARVVDEFGSVVILKNNAPRYVILDYGQIKDQSHVPDAQVEEVAKSVLMKNLEAFKALAQ